MLLQMEEKMTKELLEQNELTLEEIRSRAKEVHMSNVRTLESWIPLQVRLQDEPECQLSVRFFSYIEIEESGKISLY